jgi:hypothetical protein
MTAALSMSWSPAARETADEPARLYADIANLISVEEDAFRLRSRVQVDVLRHTVPGLYLQVPAGFTVLEVTGEGVGEWRAVEKKEGQVFVPFLAPRKGTQILSVVAERLSPEKSATAAFDGVHANGAVRERSFVGVELKTSAEVTTGDVTSLDRLDPKQLPPELLGLAERPLLYGFRALTPPYGLTLAVRKHEEVPVISAVIDQMNGVTMVLDDGKRVHQVTAYVRNSWNQFLAVELPKKAEVWSAFVDGQPVKPSRDEKGRLLIPLSRSRTDQGQVAAFPVEFVYMEPEPALPLLGKSTLELPRTDLLASQVLWSLYLPEAEKPFWFGGTLDRASAPLTRREGNNFWSSRAGGFADRMQVLDKIAADGEVAQEQAASAPVRGAQISSDALQLKAKDEAKFFRDMKSGGREAGVFPVRVQVPIAGRVFQFHRSVVTASDPVRIAFGAIRRGAARALQGLLLAGFIIASFRYRKRVAEVAALLRERSSRWIPRLRPLGTPAGTAGACAVLAAMLSLISPRASLAGAILLAAALVRWHRHRRAQQEPAD